MFLRKTTFAVLLFCSLFFTVGVAHAQMMRGYVVTDDGSTAAEEAEGKILVQQLAAGQRDCASFTPDEFERIGEYYMGLMAGDAHVSMNAMMARQLGEEGEEQMHVLMGERLSGCDPSAGADGTVWQASWMPMMGMMGGISGSAWRYGTASTSSAGWEAIWLLTIGLFWTVGVVALVVLVRSLLVSGPSSKGKR